MSEVMSRDTDSAPSRVLILKLTADGDKFVNVILKVLLVDMRF